MPRMPSSGIAFLSGAATAAFAIALVLVLSPRSVSGEKSASLDAAALRRCLIPATDATDEERAFLADVETALQTSAHGQALLQAAVGECPSKGPIVIKAVAFTGSFLVNDRGAESVTGERGREDDDRSPRVISYNRLFLTFTNHPTSVSFASAVIAQELTRMLLRPLLRKAIYGYDDVVKFSLVEEEYVRTKGYLVAFESTDEVTGATLEAADFESRPQAFLDRLKLRYQYALAVQQSELRDPVHAYERRIADLNTLAGQLQVREREIPDLLDALDHALHSHAQALGQSVDSALLLQDQLTVRLQTLAREREETRLAVKNVTEMISLLQTPVGQATLRKLSALSYDPAFAELVSDYSSDLDTLHAMVTSKSLRKPEEARVPMTEAEFKAQFDRLHPGSPKPPWNDAR